MSGLGWAWWLLAPLCSPTDSRLLLTGDVRSVPQTDIDFGLASDLKTMCIGVGAGKSATFPSAPLPPPKPSQVWLLILNGDGGGQDPRVAPLCRRPSDRPAERDVRWSEHTFLLIGDPAYMENPMRQDL
jgi:hypothetical protein